MRGELQVRRTSEAQPWYLEAVHLGRAEAGVGGEQALPATRIVLIGQLPGPKLHIQPPVARQDGPGGGGVTKATPRSGPGYTRLN